MVISFSACCHIAASAKAVNKNLIIIDYRGELASEFKWIYKVLLCGNKIPCGATNSRANFAGRIGQTLITQLSRMYEL